MRPYMHTVEFGAFNTKIVATDLPIRFCKFVAIPMRPHSLAPCTIGLCLVFAVLDWHDWALGIKWCNWMWRMPALSLHSPALAIETSPLGDFSSVCRSMRAIEWTFDAGWVSLV